MPGELRTITVDQLQGVIAQGAVAAFEATAKFADEFITLLPDQEEFSVGDVIGILLVIKAWATECATKSRKDTSGA